MIENKHSKKGAKSSGRRINIVDIESIEPFHKSSSFALFYYEHVQDSSGSGGLFGPKKPSSPYHVLREEHFQSRHLGDIIYAY